MEELKPCPFCGSDAQLLKEINIFGDGFDYFVLCDNLECEVRTSPDISPDVVEGKWNTRPDSWISVEERLPDTTTVLGCNIEGFVTTVLYMSNAKRWTIAPNLSVMMDVTHWMPLPEPPKLKGSE